MGANGVRIAAAGDIHCSEAVRPRIEAAFSSVRHGIDLVLLAGDLTAHGEPGEAAVLADACRGLDVPIFAVLGNHDWHADRRDQLVGVIESAGIQVLERASRRCEINGTTVGIVGTKGFVGGFPDSELPNFGEPLLRRVYAETSHEVDALERGLSEVADCALRIVLLHYSPARATLEGERRTIWAFLGSDRLARPIERHEPDLVLHGHAHGGTFAGSVGEVPVYNVAVPVMGRDWWIFDLEGGMQTPDQHPEIHIETEAVRPPGQRIGPH